MMQNYRPFTGITPAVKILLILNIVMYFLSMFIDSRMHVDTAHLLGLHLPQSVFLAPMAICYTYVYARVFRAFVFQYVRSFYVRPDTGIGMGNAAFSDFLFCLRYRSGAC